MWKINGINKLNQIFRLKNFTHKINLILELILELPDMEEVNFIILEKERNKIIFPLKMSAHPCIQASEKIIQEFDPNADTFGHFSICDCTLCSSKFYLITVEKEKLLFHGNLEDDSQTYGIILFAMTILSLIINDKEILEKQQITKKFLKKNLHKLEMTEKYSKLKMNLIWEMLHSSMAPMKKGFQYSLSDLLCRSLELEFADYILTENTEIFIEKLKDLIEKLCRQTKTENKSHWIRNLAEKSYTQNKMKSNIYHLKAGAKLEVSIFPLSDDTSGPGNIRGVFIIARIGFLNSIKDNDIEFLENLSELLLLFARSENLLQSYKNSLQMKHELRVAENIQKKLIPDVFPTSQKVDVYGFCQSHDLVGGDFLNSKRLSSDRIGAIISDVCGKGLPAALLANMMYSQVLLLWGRKYVDIPGFSDELMYLSRKGKMNDSQIKALHERHLREINGSELLSEINNSIAGYIDDSKFITSVSVFINEKADNIEIANAGHTPVLFYRPEIGCELCEQPAPPIGIQKGLSFPSRIFNFKKGDIFIIYTDGVTEARSANDSDQKKMFYGEQRLLKIVEENHEKTSYELTDIIYKSVEKFCAGNFADDVTILTIKAK